MPLLRSWAWVFAVAVLGLAVERSSAGWPAESAPFEFPGLLLAVLLASSIGSRHLSAAELDSMRPSFPLEFAVLLLHGPSAAMLAATSGEVAHALSPASGRPRLLRTVFAIATGLLAFQMAGAAYTALGGAFRHLEWPAQAAPIAAAAAACCLFRGVMAGVVVPLTTTRRVDPEWASHIVESWPQHIVGATIGLLLTASIVSGTWHLLLASVLPLAFAHRAYLGYLDRRAEARHRGTIADSLLQGMAVVNHRGEVTFWDENLQRLVGCPAVRALGRPLGEAVPAFRRSALETAIDEVLSTRSGRTVMRVALPTFRGARILDVNLHPVGQGAALLWQDVTERTRGDNVTRRTEERLALAAEAANDGLWEWDLKKQECFFSGRWRSMLGLSPEAGVGRPEEWLGRVHPDDVGALKDALKAHLTGATDRLQHEHRIRHEDGSYRWFLCRGVAIRSGPRAGRLAGSLTDQSEGPLGRDRLGTAGSLDPLTGLANRTVFIEQLGRRLAGAKEDPAADRFAVLYLDLDRFKVVNDSLGHLVGDQLLTAVSRRLESCLRPTDMLARLGGDEFAILLSSLSNEQQANAIAFRLQESLSEPFSIGGREVFTTASIGIALGLTDYASPDELMRDADTAMYHAKTRGKARHEMFDADMHARVRDRLGLENDLRRALVANAFDVHYQPIVLLASGMCVGFESLIRWTRNGEAVPPAKFIPLAEELGLIESLGAWVLRESCRTFADWRRRMPAHLDYITVNVSSRQLVQQNFLGVVERAVTEAGMEPSDLRLEITETALMDSPKAAGVLRELRDFGVKIYLDDFGTGYSSLSHLHRLPVDALKIDRSFVNSLLLPDRPAIVESILALARTLNTSVVAEGIETVAQAQELARLGCTHAQGYLFSRPLSTQAAEEMLARNQPLGPARTDPAADGDPLVDAEPYAKQGPFTWPAAVPRRQDGGEGTPERTRVRA